MDFSKYKKALYIKTNSFISIVDNINLDITDGYEVDIEITSNSEYVGFIYNYINNYLVGTERVNNGLEFWIGNTYYKVPEFRRGIIKVDSIKDGNIYINGKFETSIPYNNSFFGGIPGFVRNTPKIYDIKIIKESGDLKYHFIPVVDIATNIAGLYDEVNDKFYGNSNIIYKIYGINFSKVTSLQIPEGNVTKIEDKEGKVLWANINKLAYGVRWNSVNQATTACERIGNLELHKTLPIQSRFKVCIHKGKEIQYYCHPDDSRFVEDSKKAEFTYQKADMNLTACDGLPTGVVSCEENSVVKCKFINENLFSNYRFLYSYVYIEDNVSNAVAIGRIVYIDTTTHEAYIDDSENIQESDYVCNESVDRYPIRDAIDRPWFSDSYTVELGCSINGYDGEIGVDTGGKFYQWSVDNDGDNNEVWQSLYKCVPYAREIKRHIIGIDRACVLNVAFNDTKWGWIGSLEANTAVNVINYHTNLRGGSNNSRFDKYLGVDNFRCQFGKSRTNLPLATMRSYSQKTDGGQMLYKQIWEAIVWSYVIEYADFDVKKAYKSELTTEGYHQGGLGNGVIGGNDLGNYNNTEKFVPNDYTLELGNNTGIKNRAAKGNQIAWNVPHWRGFNVFWYGDIWINIDNMLTKYDDTKQKRIWYYTDDVSKFSNDITNKEHQIEGLGNVNENWLQEVRINNKGDIVPSKIVNNTNYKNSYHWNYTDNGIHTTFSGGLAARGSRCGLLCLDARGGAGVAGSAVGFAKVTILDN